MITPVSGLVAVWLLSCGPLLIPGAEAHLAGVSRLALSSLPWVACAGLPRASTPESGLSWWVILAASLPPLALGLRLDLLAPLAPLAPLANGERGDLVLLFAAILAFTGVLAGAAERAARETSTARLHAILWLALIPGFPLLRAALEWGGEPGFGRIAWLDVASDLSPLTWIASRLVAPAGREPLTLGPASWPRYPLVPLALCAGLWAITFIGSRGDRDIHREPAEAA